MALSRGEIKKCGFKPTTDKEREKSLGWKLFERPHLGGKVELHLINEDEGLVELVKWGGAIEGECDTPGQSVFLGRIPARHELQIILRCTGVA